jgi:hypothetical protein
MQLLQRQLSNLIHVCSLLLMTRLQHNLLHLLSRLLPIMNLQQQLNSLVHLARPTLAIK